MSAQSVRTGGWKGLPRGLRIALIVTLILTVASFAVRQWRQSRSSPKSAAELSLPAQDKTAAGSGNSAPATGPAPGPAAAVPQPSTGLRPVVPAASVNPMGSRSPPPPKPEETAKAEPVPPPPPPLPPPSFRLIGRYADASRLTVFFVQNDQVIAVKPGDALPDGFVLKSVRQDGVTVMRRANREKIEMPLEMPK